MIKFIFPLFFVLVSFISCSKEQTTPDFFSRIKTLEYSREQNAAKWETLYRQLKTDDQKQALLKSVAKIKSRSCIPFLARALRHSVSDSISKAAIFALGQSGGAEAENVLLRLPFDSLKTPAQTQLLFALSQCGSEQAIPFLQRRLKSGSFPRQTFSTLAHLRRKGVGKSFFPEDSSRVLAYYLYYAAEFKHLPLTISLLSHAKPANQKYLFKTLVKKAALDSGRFRRILRSDSLALGELKTALLSVLSKKTDWKIQLYALPLVPLLRDSILTGQLRSFYTSSNPHLFLSAVKASVAPMSSSEASSLLLSFLGSEQNPFLRAELLKLLARFNNQIAYRIIMQDLDKGTNRYKIALLDALAQTEIKPALNTIRQFLAVPNPPLANKAFELLAKRGLIYKQNIQQLLASEAFSSVTIALEQCKKERLKLAAETLLNLYHKFSTPADFEVQKAVVNYFSEKTVLTDTLLQNRLWDQAAHPFMQRLLIQKDPTLFPGRRVTKKYLEYLPVFLRPDSLDYNHKNPQILIKTSRGEITIELYIRDAPLTVHNFLHLTTTGFYRRLDFHRVVSDFVIQGGDPEGDGWGGTDYLIPSEDNGIPFERGSVGIATSGFDTGSCQFFICQSGQPHLTGNYTNFGRVIKGMDVVNHILPGDKILDIKRLDGNSL